MSFDHTFYEIAALVPLAAAGGLPGLTLRRYLVVSFIGVLAGPDVLGLTTSTEYISLMAEISIAVLLFLVGFKLDVKLVSTLGPVALATGLAQRRVTPNPY